MLFTIFVHWLTALHLMHQGYWCAGKETGYICTRAIQGGFLPVHETWNRMLALIHTGHFCTHTAKGWICALRLSF